MKAKKITNKYQYCNHHHEIDENYELIDLGDGEFVANKDAIPLLKALNEAGLKTRTHHYVKGVDHAFVGIMMDNVEIRISTVNERDANRTTYNGRQELLISWDLK